MKKSRFVGLKKTKPNKPNRWFIVHSKDKERLFEKTKPISKRTKGLSIYFKGNYEEYHALEAAKNKPNSNPNLLNFLELVLIRVD